MNFLGVFCLGCATGTNRPNGFVRHYQRRERDRVEPVGGRIDLTKDDLERLPGLALLQALSDAEDRHQLVYEKGRHLLSYTGVGLAEELSPFGVSDDAVGASGVEE